MIDETQVWKYKWESIKQIWMKVWKYKEGMNEGESIEQIWMKVKKYKEGINEGVKV